VAVGQVLADSQLVCGRNACRRLAPSPGDSVGRQAGSYRSEMHHTAATMHVPPFVHSCAVVCMRGGALFVTRASSRCASRVCAQMGELGECQLHGQWPQDTSHLLRTISHLRVTVEVKWHTHALVLCGKCHKCDVARLLRLRMDAWECMQDLA
jgi:hypothetical protein